MKQLNPLPNEKVPAEDKARNGVTQMSEIERSTSPREETTQRLFWGTIILTGTLLLLYVLVFTFLLQIEGKTPIVYISMMFFIFATATSVSGIVFTLRHQYRLGLNFTYYSFLFVVLIITSSFVGRALPGSFLLLIVSGIAIGWLYPRSSRRWPIVAAVVTLMLIWVVEWFNPAWRQPWGTLPIGPIVGVFLGLIFAIFLLRRAWSGSLRSKMVAAFVITAVVSVGTVAFLTNRSLNTSLTEQIGTSLSTLANTKATEIGQAVDREADVLKALSFDKAVQDAAQTASQSGSLSLAEIDRLDQQWRAADAADNNADPLVAGILNNSLSSDLRRFQKDFPQHVEVFVTDTQGVSIASTNRTSDYYQADEEWWQTAYQEGLYVGQPEYDESSKSLAIVMATVIRANGSENIVGVLRTTVNFDTLADLLAAGSFGKTGHTDIYLPTGQELALEAGDAGAFNIVMKEPELDINLLAQSQEPYLEISANNIPTLASQSAVSTIGDVAENEKTIANLDWRVVVLQDQAEALQPVQTQTRNLLLLALGITILAVVAAIGLAQLISGPIVRLKAVAEKVASGDLSAQAHVETGDETGALATTFNSMTARLRESIDTLEERVAERTRNLELAADVGRSVSQVRDLNVMLQDACELIRNEFDLYYVQVYLADPSLMILQLQAGTGEVGAQLLERKHRLQLNTGSINGRAAVEKRTMVISDTSKSATFRPNSLLPDTRGEMAVPLIVNDKVVGVLDMQSSQPDALNEEAIPAFEALAGQLAVAIQNATLLEEAKQARAEVEAQARRLVRKNWADYLDAVHKPEQIGFVFDRNEIAPLEAADELPDESRAVSAPISLTGEEFGSLVVELDNERNEQTSELVNTVARQVAQQLENLRLLDSAERYRFEAEQAARRQTRQGWQEFVNTWTGDSLGYLFDRNEVRPYSNGKDNASALNVPLKVRDETIGKLSIDGLDSSDGESVEFANAVAERLSAHIESLRQHDQTQAALAQSEKLFDASRSLTQATDLQELVAAAVGTLDIQAVNRAVLTTFDYDSAGEIEHLNIVANWWNGEGHEVTPIGTRYPLEVIRVMPMFVSPTPVFFDDAFTDERVDATTMELVKRQNLRAVAVLPLHLGTQQIGALVLEAETPHNFTPAETRLFTSLAPQIATVLENRQQYEKAQHQAEREAMLNAINQKIQSATSVEAVLQIAARELGHALGAPMTIAQLSMKDRN
jgi:GAF domain-containing protein/HAMP domain-containing protein